MPGVIAPAVPTDAAAVAEVVVAHEIAHYGQTTFAQADLEREWAQLDLVRDALVVREGGRVVGYGAVRERRESCQVEGYVHPDAVGRGIGELIAVALEQGAAREGARKVQNSVFETDAAANALLDSLGYRLVRIHREMRIELDSSPPAAAWPEGLRADPFDPVRDAAAFHAANQEAFADIWGHTPRDFEAWSRFHLGSERFDPGLWCVVRDGDEIAAGTISTPHTYGGGWIHVVFTRRPWRRRGLGSALLRDAFGRLWERGERNVGLSVDSASETGAFRLYEREGMAPMLGWALYEKELGSG